MFQRCLGGIDNAVAQAGDADRSRTQKRLYGAVTIAAEAQGVAQDGQARAASEITAAGSIKVQSRTAGVEPCVIGLIGIGAADNNSVFGGHTSIMRPIGMEHCGIEAHSAACGRCRHEMCDDGAPIVCQ